MEIRGTIVQEPWGDGLIRTYDSEGYYILQNETGIKYTEAIDIPNRYTYSETDELIPTPEDSNGNPVQIWEEHENQEEAEDTIHIEKEN